MSMVGGLDLHRGQMTFDVVSIETGEVWRGRVSQPTRARLGHWLESEVAPRADGRPVALAVEGCTGWRYVVEEITAAGFEAHLAEPADTQAARGRKRRAKTDRTDARLLRTLLADGDLPESWIPPQCVLEWRERVRCTSRSSISAPSGSSVSTPNCFSTGYRFPTGRSPRRRPGPGCATPSWR